MLEVRNGRAATIVVDGEAGVGKTSFIRALMNMARADGMKKAEGAAHPFETTRPFGALAEALDLRGASDDPRRASIGELLVGDQPGDAPTSGADLRYRVVDEVVDLVETECSPAPLLLVLEDVHWADTSTLLAVRSMARELVHLPLLLAISMRPSPRSGELKQLLDDLLEVGARLISLDPLSSPEIDALVRAELGVPPGPELAAIVAKAGGNPLWAVEILRSLSTEGRLQRESEVAEVIGPELPDSLRELVLRRLRDLPQETLDLLQVVAVLGDAVTIGDLATVTRRSAVDLVPALGGAFRSRLLGEEADTVVFRHQLVHDAIYQSMPQPVRSALHRDAAGALADAGADLSQVASHLVLGAGPGDLDAVRWLRDAARDATRRAPAEAVELLRCAERLLPDSHPDVDLVAAEIVEALLLAGNVAEAAEHAKILLERPHRADVDTAVRLWLLETLSLQNLGPELIERAEATFDGAHDLSDAQKSLVLAQASYGRTFSGEYVDGEATARRALYHAERAGDAAMTVWSLGTLSLPVKTQGRYTEALMLSRRAVDLAFEPPNDPARLRHPYFFLSMSLSDADLLDEAREAFRRTVDECSTLGSSWILPDALLLAAEQRFIVGEWDDARSEFEAGLRVAHERGHKISIPQTRASEAIMAIARGDHRAAEVALATVRSHLVSDVPEYGVEMVAFATAMLAEAEGEATKAHDLLLRFWQLDEQRENRYYHRYLAPQLVRLSLLLDEADVARAVTEAVEAGAELAPDVPTVQAAALRCRGLVDRDPDLMTRAVELARPIGRLIDHTAACEDAGGVLASAGRIDEAVSLWSEALERYEDIGADAWSMRVLALLRRHGVRRGTRGPRQRPAAGWDGLTPTEHAVSDLVAEGLTNREIARRLHVSPHTVNTHLRHIFQKLSVPSRAALAAEVARHGSDHAIE